jgi:hypothetical protein
MDEVLSIVIMAYSAKKSLRDDGKECVQIDVRVKRRTKTHKDTDNFLVTV